MTLRCREGDFFLFSQRKDWGKIDFLVCGHMNLFDAEQLDIPITCRRTPQREFFEELGHLGNIVGRNLLKKHRLECVLKHHNIGNNSLELIQCVESEVDTQTFPVSFLSRILYALSAKYLIVEKSLALEMGTIQENLLSNRFREYLIYKSGVLLQY